MYIVHRGSSLIRSVRPGAAAHKFDKWLEWETQTKQFYEENYKTATGCEKGILEKLIKDVTKEICEAKKEYIKLKISDYNIEVILKM